jgi:PTH1 family peptidyl-tRNA hydrolase
LLVKPQTFMNESGQAVGRLWRWYRLRLEDLLVIGDDIDLPFGRLRLRPRGSAGGHRGLQSIFTHLGSQDVARLKIGIGRPDATEARDYVLSSFRPEERAELPAVLARAADAVELVLRDGPVAAMNVINCPSNSHPPAPSPSRGEGEPAVSPLPRTGRGAGGEG